MSRVKLAKEYLFKVHSFCDFLHDSKRIDGRDDFIDCVTISSTDWLDQNWQLIKIFNTRFLSYIMKFERGLCRLGYGNYIDYFTLGCTHVVREDVYCQREFRVLVV